MAKLKAPLLSLGAAGAIGKSIVFFNWKGIDVVREYVVPANPKTTPQNTQRGYLKAAVTLIHYCQGLAANPLVAADASAYALLGSLQPTPRTWFNTICRQWLKQRVAGQHPSIYHGGGAVGGSTEITLTAQVSSDEIAVDDGKIYYGTSPSALINSVDCTKGELAAGHSVTSLVAGTKYYLQYRPNSPAKQVGSNSGIFYAVPTA